MSVAETGSEGFDGLDDLMLPERAFPSRERSASHPDLVAALSHFGSACRAEVRPDGSVVVDSSRFDSRNDEPDDC